MFVDKQLVGAKGEDLAAEHLMRQSWKVLHRNLRTKRGELDLIARAPDGTLVFIEVKALNASGDIQPEDHLTPRKLTRVRTLAHTFANANPHLIHEAG